MTEFVYAVPAATIADLQAIESRIIARRQADTESVIATGHDLLAAKTMLGHGRFGPWLIAKFAMTSRTAQRYMAAAEWAVGKSDIVSVLPPTVLIELTAPSTPEPVREAVIEEVRQGKPVTVAKVKSMKATPKPTPTPAPRSDPKRDPARYEVDRERTAKARAYLAAHPDRVVTVDELAEHLGGSDTIVRTTLAYLRGQDDGRMEGAPLSESMQARFERKVQRYEQEFAARVQMGVEQRVTRHVAEHLEPHYVGLRDDAARVIKARKGVMTRKEWNLLIKCLHPDRVNPDPKDLDEATQLIYRLKLILLDEQQMPTQVPPLNTMAAMRQAREEVRRQNSERSRAAHAARRAAKESPATAPPI